MTTVPSTFLGQLFTRKLFAFSGSTLLVYDHAITLSLEVAYIWNAPWTFVKALFLVNRYGNLIGQIFILLEETGHLSRGSKKFCMAFQLYCSFFAVFSGESIRLLVVMRACAILGCNRRIAVLSSTLYVMYSIAILVLSSYMLKTAKGLQFAYLNETGVCFMPTPPHLWQLWFMPLCLDGVILAVVCFSLSRLIRWSRGYSPSPLVRLLARDAFLFYFAALFNVLFFIVCWTTYAWDPRNFLATSSSFAFLSIIGQRLVLNLRRQRLQPGSTRDLSQQVHRHVAVIVDEQTFTRSGPGLELELDPLGNGRQVA